MSYPDLSLCFKDGFIFRERGHEYSLSVRHIGDLVVTSGAILATDPFAPIDQDAFSRKVTPGIYAVSITVAAGGELQDIAFAKVRFADGAVVRWEIALTPEEERISESRSRQSFGYAVSSGTGCFMDVDQFEAYEKMLAGDESFGLRLLKEYQDGAQGPVATLDYKCSASPLPGNIVMFSSGLGDGVYASYWGMDARDEVVALVTSFGVVGKPEAAALRHASLSSAKKWWKIWK